jgi:hypothetical protein
MKSILTLLAVAVAATSYGQNDPKNYHVDKEFKITANGVLKLDASNARVTITGSSRETAHVKIDRVVTSKGWVFGEKAFGVEINEDANGLTIHEKPHSVSGIIGFYSEKYTIEIEVPASVSLTVRGDDGNYNVSHINGAVAFDLDDADVELTECDGSSFRFSVDDGRIKMNRGKGKLEIKGDDAHVEITNGSFSSVTSSTDDGSVSIETSLADKGDYHINAEDGQVILSITGGGGKIDIHHDDGRVTADSKFDLLRDTDERKQYNLANGTATVDIRTDDARVRLISR